MAHLADTQYGEISRRVFSPGFTRAGTALLPILDALGDWAILYYPDHIFADFIKRTPRKECEGNPCAERSVHPH